MNKTYTKVTETQFNIGLTYHPRFSKKAIDVCREVLINGTPQKILVEKYKVSKQLISAWVCKMYDSCQYTEPKLKK